MNTSIVIVFQSLALVKAFNFSLLVLDRGGGDDFSFWDDSDDKLDSSLDLDREWQRRHDQFHTVFV